MVHEPLSEQENHAVLRVCALAAFADGSQDETERAQIEQIVKGLPGSAQDSVLAYQDVLQGKVSVSDAAKQLNSESGRTLAYEMAVCVCNADGVLQTAEKDFLAQLRQELRLNPPALAAHQNAAQALAAQPLAGPVPPVIDVPGNNDVDRRILDTAILCGALEIMPHTLATMAIVPLQTRMVYQVGKGFGFELDRGHIRDFFATIGVGLTSQVFEGFASRLVRGFTRRVAGRLVGSIAGQAAGSAVAFATTYALGQVAKAYYSSGRTLTSKQLKEVFSSMLDEARGLQSRYSGEIASKASQLNVSQLMPLVRS